VVADRAWIHLARLRQGGDDRGEQEGVGTRPDGEVDVGLLGGAASAGVDHHQPTAAGLHGLDAARPVGRGGEAAVRRVGVAPEDTSRSVRSTSGTGTVSPPPNSHADDSSFGPLVDGARREDVPGARAPSAAASGRAGPTGCGRWGCRRTRRAPHARALGHPSQPLLDRGVRLLPGGGLELDRRGARAAYGAGRGRRGAAATSTPWGRGSQR
jgi:hypothetical protein